VHVGDIPKEIPVTVDSYEAIKHRIWLWCIWSWPVCLVVFAFGFIVLAGFIPPPREFWSAERIAEMYAENRTGIRAGIIVAMFASALMLPFYTVISAEIRKIEGRLSLLAPIQLGGAVILVAFFQIICLLWLLASLRPEADPQIIRAANDYCWLVWSTLIPTYSLQYVCMAIAGFMDKRPHPAWPRWAAYLNLWVAFTGAGGVLAVFFKTGPFAWHGLIGFWIPVILFAVGMSITAVLLHRRARYEAQFHAGPEDDGVVRVERVAVSPSAG
jgi:hypothetical protein